jgi:K+/H+ antiporter YhaU regulatory subunit KhtT
MRTAAVGDQGLTVERLPGVGRRYVLPGRDGQRLSVVIDARGGRHLSIEDTDSGHGENAAVRLNEAQASLLSMILTGTFDLAAAAWSQ